MVAWGFGGGGGSASGGIAGRVKRVVHPPPQVRVPVEILPIHRLALAREGRARESRRERGPAEDRAEVGLESAIDDVGVQPDRPRREIVKIAPADLRGFRQGVQQPEGDRLLAFRRIVREVLQSIEPGHTGFGSGGQGGGLLRDAQLGIGREPREIDPGLGPFVETSPGKAVPQHTLRGGGIKIDEWSRNAFGIVLAPVLKRGPGDEGNRFPLDPRGREVGGLGHGAVGAGDEPPPEARRLVGVVSSRSGRILFPRIPDPHHPGGRDTLDLGRWRGRNRAIRRAR